MRTAIINNTRSACGKLRLKRVFLFNNDNMNRKDYSKHHYVPEAYLKIFSFTSNNVGEQKLYKFSRKNIDFPIPERFKSFTPSQICYDKYLYKIENKHLLKLLFEIEDDNYAEQYAFKVYENNLIPILKKITTKLPFERKFITISEANIFVKSLVNLKKRNPYLLNDPDHKAIIEEKAAEGILRIRRTPNYDNDPEILEALDFLNKVIIDPDYSKDLAVISLIADSIRKESVLTDLADALMKNVWYIYESTINDIFITSDNPGFSKNYKGELFNVNFLENGDFFFPLTPSHTLRIDSTRKELLFSPFKEIFFKDCPPHKVRELNMETLSNSDIIFSNSEKALFATIDNYKKYHKSWHNK